MAGGLPAAIRWCRVAQPPVKGWHPCRGANLWGVRFRWFRSWTRSTTGYEPSSLRDEEAGEGGRSWAARLSLVGMDEVRRIGRIGWIGWARAKTRRLVERGASGEMGEIGKGWEFGGVGGWGDG